MSLLLVQNENKSLTSSLAQQDRSCLICHQKGGTRGQMVEGLPPVAELPAAKVHLKLGSYSV